MKKKTITLGALEKTMKKKKIEPMGVLEKTRNVRRRLNPCFCSLNFLPKNCKHEGRKSKICVDLQKHKRGEIKVL
jgi:hypothetical protein